MSDPPDEIVTVDGHEIELSNLSKVLFPESGLTKSDLIDYYRRVSDIALPYFRDRPLSMQRFPDGIADEGFFQKQIPDYFPDWVDRVDLSKRDGRVTHIVANNAATLVYLANQGCITPHLSLSRQDRPNHPDRLIFDLDPPDDDFGKVQKAARSLKSLLDELQLSSFVQTTGSRGLHVVVPLDRSADFDAIREFARALGQCLAKRHAGTVTVEQRKDRRGTRVFVDYLRNAYGQTAVAPYAVRAIEGGPIATPLRWDEVGSSELGPRKYTIRNAFRRLAQIDDPWAEIQQRPCSIDAARKQLSAMD